MSQKTLLIFGAIIVIAAVIVALLAVANPSYQVIAATRGATVAGVNAGARRPDPEMDKLITLIRSGASEEAIQMIDKMSAEQLVATSGWTPLMEAAIHGDIVVVSKLIDSGADVRARDTKSRFTAEDLVSIEIRKCEKEATKGNPNNFGINIENSAKCRRELLPNYITILQMLEDAGVIPPEINAHHK